ncbi:uncharacterized protein BYT42DRAFT_179490 [Radiomyces spectabilis]|uniref:uncharacterized protein n=1 Tax=Radiomyces spectabilis TaxID=64574 RepID=UPI00221E52CD|nr:uncharacterized protein BYT42DRAFT_179490 [Radiomyces spectabilis]KAI8391028.1 hypothetical protein BYT42DRAFT_179490 [Radiomyces spectabilis]
MAQKNDKYWKPRAFADQNWLLPVVGFGAGMFGKDSIRFKGHRVGATRVLHEELTRRQKGGELLVVTVDEFQNVNSMSWLSTGQPNSCSFRFPCGSRLPKVVESYGVVI